MTTQSTRLPDWKVTTGYRVLVKIGWGIVILATYLAGAASILDAIAVWWMVVVLALVAILTVLLLPEPVPREMITGPKNHIEARR